MHTLTRTLTHTLTHPPTSGCSPAVGSPVSAAKARRTDTGTTAHTRGSSAGGTRLLSSSTRCSV